ncbi:MAG: BACON domain-containing carbohydrate-binding protein [Bryobacteraceae bacterium]|jgi:uncharacterized protein (TIGR03437 family)
MKLFLAFLAAMPLCAQCTYIVNPLQTAAISYTAAIGQISVVASGIYCGWTYASDSSWLTFNGQANGQSAGSYTIVYAVTANTIPASRTAKIKIADSAANTVATVAVTQQASPCLLNLTSTAYEIGVGAGSSTFAVQSDCVWNSWSNANWITVTSGGSGTSNGTIGYSVAANPCAASRSGTLTVEAGSSTPVALGSAYPYPVPQFTVNQDGSAGNLMFTPASASFSAAGGTGYLIVTTGAGCSWGAVYTNVNWIGISSTSYGNGPGPLSYTVSANTGASRTGVLYIGTLAFSVTQQAAAPPTPQIAAVDHSASFASALGTSGAVSPGEIVSIFGNNLGPFTGVGLQLASNGTTVATILGGAQVLFDGKAAALTYASNTQINAAVPFEVAGKPSTSMTVAYQGGISAATVLNVQAANPGIYTLDGSGSGPGAILNQDYSINSVARPAAPGSAVQIFLTGGGVTNPPSPDASITPSDPLPWLSATPTVTIGGVPAQVVYSGGAPGAIAGLAQIDATVPSGVPPGSSVPVLVTIGSATSQPGVIIAVN